MILVNGRACMDPKFVQPAHFSFSGLHIAGNTSNRFGSVVTPVNVAQIPGLNTLGISLARIDYAAWGVLPPHMHPCATEILTVLEGTLEPLTLRTDSFQKFFRRVMCLFFRNVGYGSAVSISGLSSQNPGVITVANAVFGSNPPMPTDMLAKAFQVDKNVVDNHQVIF
ncbi:unnamed protein product [Ilex paraguariensis]|uniref:Cupin type-1 domain-containing protein n=1 Tax=Ilex paraguariensis TaxID=185542 RepID=A0ABC8SWH9_9AQUA